MDTNIKLSNRQISIVEQSHANTVFLEGPAGSGKTTMAVARLMDLLVNEERADSIIILLPQRTLAQPYYLKIQNTPDVLYGMVTILTVGGLAKRMIELFWPLISEKAGFGSPTEAPNFLTLETAQYYMSLVLKPYFSEGLFESVTIDRNRLYSQTIDNLNKSAVVGFPYSDIGEKLKSAWVGEPGQLNVYDDVQKSATLYRQYCLSNNLLDFSLQMDTFINHLWTLSECRNYLNESYSHMIFDNLEEDTPMTHDLMIEWLPEFQSAFLVFDWQAGYRRFLGADDHSAYRLKDHCHFQFVSDEVFISDKDIENLTGDLWHVIGGISDNRYGVKYEIPKSPIQSLKTNSIVEMVESRFYTQMLEWVASEIDTLIKKQGESPADIAVLAPFLPDAMRFSLVRYLDEYEIPVQTHRPSRSLREEPAALCMLTLAALSNPEWEISPSRSDVTNALMLAIDGIDMIRAQLLVKFTYHGTPDKPYLTPFEKIRWETQERITHRIGGRYERIRDWINSQKMKREDLDSFLKRLFGELLSQPGFGFHKHLDRGRVAADLIESVRKFRWATGRSLEETGQDLGKEFIDMVRSGVIAAQYVGSWQRDSDEAVFLAPAYTFLMSNRPVDIQFWLDIGSRAWFERIHQPLTHPYVLSRKWNPESKWTDEDEMKTSQEAMRRVVIGLLRRCRRKVYIGVSDLGEQGYEQRGPLLKAVAQIVNHPINQIREGLS